MAQIVLSRVDFRLIHGQVITKWIKYYPAKYIVIVDDVLAMDSFMAEVYAMAVPKGVKLKITSVAEAKACLDQMDATVFLLFKNIESCRRALDGGVVPGKLIVGGVPGEPGRAFVTDGVYVSPAELKMLEEIEGAGTQIVLKSIPEDADISINKAREKLRRLEEKGETGV